MHKPFGFSITRSLIAATIIAAATFNACAQTHEQNTHVLQQMQAAEMQAVLLNNSRGLLPFKSLDTRTIGVVNTGIAADTYSMFEMTAGKYAKITRVQWNPGLTANRLLKNFDGVNTIIFTVNETNPVTPQFIAFINTLSRIKSVAVVLFGNAKLAKFTNKQVPVLVMPANGEEGAHVAAEALFGGVAVTGRLTANYANTYRRGDGFTTSATRLKYTVPEELGINANDLSEIDKIAEEAISGRAAPGMVVLAAKDGKVFFEKAYGTHTYTDTVTDKLNSVFDLASITKTAATTPEVMKLVGEGKINLDSTLAYYLPEVKNSPMAPITVREVMLHQAGFVPYIPFQNYVKAGDHQADSTAEFSVRVAERYYVKPQFFKNYMWPTMINSPIKTRGKYVYSDISMYVMRAVVEAVAHQPLQQLVQTNFYKPLGMYTAGFNPLYRLPKNQIVPTENDTYFRGQLLQGDVHDQGAALAGGVSGHAGLFATANDLAILYTMFLNRGSYGGTQYLNPQVVSTFISKQSPVSRRGLGFDRYDPESKTGYPSVLAGPNTFGHTGYTGTCVWANPDNGLLYIFLSNRVNPTVTDRLSDMRIRLRILDALYKALPATN